MKITENLLNIKQILDVTRSRSPVGIIRCDSRHSDCFVYVLSGSGVYHSGGKTLIANAGDILYLPYKCRYDKYISDQNFTHIHINFFFEGDEKRDIEVYSSKQISSLDTDFRKFLKLWQFGDFSDFTECKSILYHIYGRIISSAIHSYIPAHKKNAVEKAVMMIQDNFLNPDLSVSDIAKKAEMSEVHFRRLFKTLYHTSPIKYIQSLKIEKSKSLLSDKSLNISEISEQCGFANTYYFDRVFKNKTGMTPSEYRTQNV